MELKNLKTYLERLYKHYNHKKFVHPDPLEFLYDYYDLKDREITALIASSLAYGRVYSILKALDFIFSKLNPSPFTFVVDNNFDHYKEVFKNFKYRFTDTQDICSLLLGIKKIILNYGSLKECFEQKVLPNDKTILPGLSKFFKELKKASGNELKFLLPIPENGSACKRANLFLRWMVRKDPVDPGGWDQNLCSKLVVPVDTHMHKIAYKLGLTSRKTSDIKTALEITEAFKKISPTDPVKYDFALTRPGIRKEDINWLKQHKGL